jgi:polar amino acid transport system substrate-binding protein
MKKLVLFLSLIFTFIVSNGQNLSRPLIINTQEWAPYNYSVNGKVTGSATEILKNTLNDMGVQYEIKVYPWARAQYLVENGQADGFYTASKNAKRDAYAVASDSLIPQRWNWYLLKESKTEPKNGSVGAILGSNMLKFTKDNNYSIKAQPPTMEALVKMLTSKRVNAILVNDLVMKEYLKEANISESKFKTVLSKDKPLGIYFSKKFVNENPWFLDKFNETLQKYKIK